MSAQVASGMSTRGANDEDYLKAVGVDGEVLVLRCWGCGTEHCVNVEQCTPEELALVSCSKNNCRMSLVLVNGLALDEQAQRPRCVTERKVKPQQAAYARRPSSPSKFGGRGTRTIGKPHALLRGSETATLGFNSRMQS